MINNHMGPKDNYSQKYLYLDWVGLVEFLTFLLLAGLVELQ